MDHDAYRGKHDAAAPADRGDDARLARAGTLEPTAPERRRRSKEDEEERVHPPEIGNTPVTCGGKQRAAERQVGAGDRLRHTERTRQRQPEHAEAVGHADAEMNRERGRRYEPPVESRSRNDAFPIEKSRQRLRGGYFHGITDT